MTDNITAYIRARLDEDAAAAPRVHSTLCLTVRNRIAPCDCGFPAHILRGVGTRRRILDEHQQTDADQVGDHPTGCITCHHDPDCGTTHGHGTCQTVRHLATEWGSHPDYHQDWTP